MMWNGMAVGWLPMLVWVVFSVAVVVLIVLAIVWLARSVSSGGAGSSGPSTPTQGPGTAREALDLRYARGEISREEYLQARRDLEERP